MANHAALLSTLYME